MDKIAQIHGASDGVTLLAASSNLAKNAKRWYEIQSGAVLETWANLRQEIIKIFDRKIPFYKAAQKVEARKWNWLKESFDQYAIDKMTLMYRMDLPTQDMIDMIIGGITRITR